MRRAFAIILMLLVPLQLAWSAVEAIDGHLDRNVSEAGYHVHQHASSQVHAGHDDHDDVAIDDSAFDHHGGVSHGDDGSTAGHYHHVLSFLAVEPVLNLAGAAPGHPPSRPADTFISHIPPLFDWPPAARV